MNEASFNVKLVTKSGEQFRLQNVMCVSINEPDIPTNPFVRKYVFITDCNTRIQRLVSDIKSLEIEYVKPEKENKKTNEK